ncbi:DUF1810 domain-containing protein [Pseudarthrobacter sp. P1]|uniref:DUF1810 domain-containing protein n=1 Tax=Pseudarthrobacter sp. P1 TaxID=3418418 RepID=UPI003CEF9F5E
MQRFIDAQSGGVYERAAQELARGSTESHWMWFIFPQLAGLGHSAMSELYAIASLAQAGVYLGDPVLGPRLLECARMVADAEGRSAVQIFGRIDAQKLRSCMTLFARAAPGEAVFQRVLARCFQGQADPLTEQLLADGAGRRARS